MWEGERYGVRMDDGSGGKGEGGRRLAMEGMRDKAG
mgnify:CR=1 FL=1